MVLLRIFLITALFFAVINTTKSQIVGFRIGTNTGMFLSELGESDLLHPNALALSSATSSKKYTPQLSAGIEGEILFQVSPSSHLGVEVEYVKLKGYNDDPEYYNYYLTKYFLDFQPDYFPDDYSSPPTAFNTTLINVAANWRYFLFADSPLKPFIKLTGVVSFVGTDFTLKNAEDVIDPGTNVLYARGTSNSEQSKWPAFHVGGGVGFDYEINERWSFQVDGTLTVVNSDIVNGAPNFTYSVDDSLLKHNKQPSLIAQFSAGVVYKLEVGASGKGAKGKTDSNLPFFRKK